MQANSMHVLQIHCDELEVKLENSRIYNQSKVELFKKHLNTVDITNILTQVNPNKAINPFCEKHTFWLLINSLLKSKKILKKLSIKICVMMSLKNC